MDVPQHPKWQLADLLLDKPLDEWVAERRTEIGWKSWDRMALELRHVTEGRVVLAGNTLRRWFPEHARSNGKKAA